MNQRIDVFGCDFTVLRLLILVGILKLTTNGESRIIAWNQFDKLFLAWMSVGSLIYIIQQASISAVVYKSGVFFDGIGIYWLVRQQIRTWEDVSQIITIFAAFAIVTAPLIVLESIYSSSPFSIFGPTSAQFHKGRFRCAGSFPHSIVMGSFWANLLPLFYANLKVRKNAIFCWTAILAALSNVYFSASSTTLLSTVAIIIFWNLYNYRKHGNIIFWSTCVLLFILHLVMKKPVWHLMARVDIFSGSTGYHRYALFDNFVNHTKDWFLYGLKSTSYWGHVQSDITNQFVLQGVRGGIITLLLFTILVYFSVKIPGALSLDSSESEVRWISWGICTCMLGHFFTFWGISYFGQIDMLLYITFALVSFTMDNGITNKTQSLT